MTVLVRPAHTDELTEIGELTVRAYAADAFVDPAEDYAHQLRDAATRAREAEVYVAVAQITSGLSTNQMMPTARTAQITHLNVRLSSETSE